MKYAKQGFILQNTEVYLGACPVKHDPCSSHGPRFTGHPSSKPLTLRKKIRRS